MPTTTYTDTTFAVNAIGGRTNASAEAVSDYTAEEARFLAQILSGGRLKPADSFRVFPQDTPDMSVKIGSGTAKADYYVVEGGVGGQGTYVVRLDSASPSLSVPAADASQPRTDEIYLVVRDDTYDTGGLGLPRFGYRKGDLGGAAPGPDSSWEAYALLASVAVPALETAIEATNITEERFQSRLLRDIVVPRLETQVRYLTVDDVANTTFEPVGNEGSEFRITLRPNTLYAVDCFLWYGASQADDLQLQWGYSPGVAVCWSAWGLGPAATSGIGDINVDVASVTESATLGSPGFDVSARVYGTVFGTSGTTAAGLHFRATTGQVTIKVGSWIKFTQLA